MLRGEHCGADHGHADRQRRTREEKNPRAARNLRHRRAPAEFSPAQRTPERPVVQHGNGHIEKKKNQREQKKVGANGNLRFGTQKLLQLRGGKTPPGNLRRKVHGGGQLRNHEAHYAKKQEQYEMRPRPENAQVFRDGLVGGRWSSWRRKLRFRVRNWIGDNFRRRGTGFRGGRVFAAWGLRLSGRVRHLVVEGGHFFFVLRPGVFGQPESSAAETSGNSRSEERRVGQEWRS